MKRDLIWGATFIGLALVFLRLVRGTTPEAQAFVLWAGILSTIIGFILIGRAFMK